jgi:hypothetical protein
MTDQTETATRAQYVRFHLAEATDELTAAQNEFTKLALTDDVDLTELADLDRDLSDGLRKLRAAARTADAIDQAAEAAAAA